uniref:GNAT family N-acetyltransferase n=1 Tax=Anaerococcus mediterraneensis TaxID=1870984 RepID=UPI0009319308|nr:GNAT family protein [Anaerococcus mediterraneensis]
MSRIYLKRLEKKSALELKNWGNFSDPRLEGYNYGNLSDFELILRYGSVNLANKKYFEVRKKDDDRIIGFIGLKNINPILRKAYLGIVFDANFVSMGYGYEAIRSIFEIFFDQMKYRNLFLDVNSFNERAYRLYKKCGFTEYDKDLEIFENQKIDFDPRHFEKSRGLIYSKIIKMKISKDDYNEL